LRSGNARRLDDVQDVDANARPDLVRVSPELPAYMAEYDDRDDVAIRSADIFETETGADLVVCDRNWILRRVAGARRRNLRVWRRIRGGGDALGNFQPRCSCAFRRAVGCCGGVSIYA